MHSQSSSKSSALLLLCAIVVAMAAVLFSIQRQWKADSLRIGQGVPSFHGATIDGGTVVRDSLAGRKLLLVFFAPGCSHCRKEIANLGQIFTKYKSVLDFIGISLDSITPTKLLVNDLKLDFPIIVARNAELSEEFKVHILPSIFCIDESQVLRERYTGEHSLTEDEYLIREFISSGGRK